MSVFTREDAKRIWEEVTANSRLIQSCTGHRFIGGSIRVGERHACLECGGIMDNSALFWYISGSKHAGVDPELIWPGWKEERRGLNG